MLDVKNEPFRHFMVDDYLPASELTALLDNWPKRNHRKWRKFGGKYRGKKRGKRSTVKHCMSAGFPDVFGHVINDVFSSRAFIDQVALALGYGLQVPLVSDPELIGAGLHRTDAGCCLPMHLDFSHISKGRFHRCVNLLFYLNEDWGVDDGGSLVLGRGADAVSYLPIANRLVVMDVADSMSWHGHPAPNAKPRKSIALYYYMPEDSGTHAVRKTTEYA